MPELMTPGDAYAQAVQTLQGIQAVDDAQMTQRIRKMQLEQVAKEAGIKQAFGQFQGNNPLSQIAQGQQQQPPAPQPPGQPVSGAPGGLPGQPGQAPQPPQPSPEQMQMMQGAKGYQTLSGKVMQALREKNTQAAKQYTDIADKDPNVKKYITDVMALDKTPEVDAEKQQITYTADWDRTRLDAIANNPQVEGGEGFRNLPPGKYAITIGMDFATGKSRVLPPVKVGSEGLGKRTHEELIDLSLHGTPDQKKKAQEDLDAEASFKKKTGATASGGAGFTEDAIQQQAERYLATGVMPPMGMGTAGTKARQEVINRSARIAKERGMDMGSQLSTQSSIKASQGELSKLQAQRGVVMAFAANAEKNLKLAGQLSDKVTRSGVPVLNKWILAGKRSVAGDVDVVRFDAALRTGINEFAKVTSSATGGSVTSDSARKEVEDMLNAAQTPQQVKGIIDLLVNKELSNRRTSYDEQIQSIKDSISGKKSMPQEGKSTPPPIDAAANKGKKKRNSETGEVWESDGSTWKLVQ